MSQRDISEILHADICETKEHPVFRFSAPRPTLFLKGLFGASVTAVSYRASSPRWDDLPFRIALTHSDRQSTANSSLLTANSSYTFSAKERDPETGLSYFGSRYYSSDLSIWLSVDPMSDKYASQSPYVYCANNPVRCVDPNGEEVYIIGDVDNKNTIVDILSKYFDNITVGYDAESGKLTIVNGTAQTKDEIAFAKALSDETVKVHLQIGESQITGQETSSGKDLIIEGAGGFLGNDIIYNSIKQEKDNITEVRAIQFLSMDAMESFYDEKDWGKLINHEITESFQGGVISSETNVPGRQNGVVNTAIYKKAHAAATPQPYPIGASWNHY